MPRDRAAQGKLNDRHIDMGCASPKVGRRGATVRSGASHLEEPLREIPLRIARHCDTAPEASAAENLSATSRAQCIAIVPNAPELHCLLSERCNCVCHRPHLKSRALDRVLGTTIRPHTPDSRSGPRRCQSVSLTALAKPCKRIEKQPHLFAAHRQRPP